MRLENFALRLGTRKPGLWAKSGLSLLNWRTMGGREGGRGKKKHKAETTHGLQNLKHLPSDSWYQMFSAPTLDSLLMVSSRLWHHHIHSTLCTYIVNQVFVYSWSLYKYLQIKSKTYTHNGTLFCHKKAWSADTRYNTDESWKHCAKKPHTKGQILWLHLCEVPRYANS